MEFSKRLLNMSGDSLAQHLANGISLRQSLCPDRHRLYDGLWHFIDDKLCTRRYRYDGMLFCLFGITVFHIPWYITFVGVIMLRQF